MVGKRMCCYLRGIGGDFGGLHLSRDLESSSCSCFAYCFSFSPVSLSFLGGLGLERNGKGGESSWRNVEVLYGYRMQCMPCMMMGD